MTTANITSEGAPRMTLARHFLNIGHPQRTLEILSTTTGLDPQDWEIWYLRGQALYELERFGEALATAETGLSKEPEAVPLLFLLCNLYAQQDDLAAAEAVILKALRLHPEDPVLLCRYALLLSQGNQLDKALGLVNATANFAPTHPMVVQTRATLTYLRGDDRGMLRRSREILADNPENLFGHYMLGATLTSMGDVRGAEKQFATAARIAPENPAVTRTVREVRYQLHPLLWPLLPAYRLGAIRLWACAIGLIILLNALGYKNEATIFSVAYFAYCVYSWVVPPVLRWWLRRRAERQAPSTY